MNANDERVLALKKKIEAKKKKANATFQPVTNCSVIVGEKRYNLHAMNTKNELMMILIKLNAMLMSAKQLNVQDVYELDGYSLKDWIKDIKLKIDVIDAKELKIQLKAMEEKLQDLLSDDKRTELEIDNIEALLN